MSTQGASSSSAPSFSTHRWKYDVFLSFKGEDTRRGFTDHLYVALTQKGVFIFRDDETLQRGQLISEELFKAIQESRMAIVILSENYASSTWCLHELARIVKCKEEMGQIIMPVFYGVNPSDVRNQTGAFERAFAEHEVRYDRQKVISWRDALRNVANLSGWTVNERIYELQVIQHIVEHILGTLNSKFLSITKDLVGLDSPMEELITSYLGHENSVCMLGILGLGGMGKTTLARVIYHMVCNHFEGSCFIADISEFPKKYGLVQLQKQILAQILKERNIDIRNVQEGVDMIKSKLCHKKVILVLDGVNELIQLKKLAGHHDWFGLGSWIIITSRNKKLLEMHGVDKIYKLNGLNDHDALKLFCLNAFENEQPAEGYMQLCQAFIKYCNGIPLAILVIGSSLAGRSMNQWESALYKISEPYTASKIQNVLKISFEGLEEMCKEIFLDIACFFCGKMRDQVIEILEICGFHARRGIDYLLDRSLLEIRNNKLWMHDLLREMGEGIVRQESIREPGERSRLWLCEDLFHVMMNNTATSAIQAIVLDGFKGNELDWNFEACPKAFSKMCNLRLFIINNVHVPDGLNHFFKELRFLQWSGYSSKCLPSSFQSKELVELKLWYSKIKYLWRGIKYLDKLKLIDLECSKSLIRTPDFTGVPKLERLCLRGCINLVEIDPSIGQLSGLTVLNLEFCRSLVNLPSNMDSLRSLEILILLGCLKLANLPESLGKIKSLKELDLTETAIREVPSSISFLICHGCEKRILKSKIDNVVCFRLLKDLSLSTNNLVFNLPVSINLLLKLESLNLANCIQLHSLPELPSNVRYIIADGCSSLEPSPALLSMSILSQPSISFFNCFKLLQYNESSDGLAFAILKRHLQGLLYLKTGLYETSTKRKDRFEAAFQIIIPGLEVPQWLSHQRFGYSTCIELPPNWCDSRWMGFVLCAFFRYNCSGYSSERYSLKGHVTALGDMPSDTSKVLFFEVVIGETSFDYSVGHLWLLYWSRDDLLGTHWNDHECSRLKVVFDSNSPSVEVIKCAARLIYEQDVEESNQTITQTQDPPNTDEENALEEQLIHGGVHVNLDISTQDPVMAILDSKHPSDSFDKRKGKQKLINSQMNDVLQSMDEANKGRIEANKTKAERYMRPRVETTDPVASAVPPSSSAPTSTVGGVTLEAIMVQFQRMEADFGGRLDYLTDEMRQMNTRVGRIARRQARMVGFAPSPSPERPAASTSIDDEDDAGSSGDDEMTTSQ